MKTYPEDNYDSQEYGNIGFPEKYNDSAYCEWLENLAIKILTKDKYIDILDFEKKIDRLGVGLKYSEILHARVEDKKIRDNNPFLKCFPLCLIDPYPQGCEEMRKVNEWEIRVVAQLAQETLNETNCQVRSNDYKKFLKKLEPYRDYFLEQTWNKLSEFIISQYLSVRVDKRIPWSETNEHPDNIVYDLNKLIWADKKEERFLSIDADLNKGIFHFWRYEDYD